MQGLLVLVQDLQVALEILEVGHFEVLAHVCDFPGALRSPPLVDLPPTATSRHPRVISPGRGALAANKVLTGGGVSVWAVILTPCFVWLPGADSNHGPSD